VFALDGNDAAGRNGNEDGPYIGHEADRNQHDGGSAAVQVSAMLSDCRCVPHRNCATAITIANADDCARRLPDTLNHIAN